MLRINIFVVIFILLISSSGFAKTQVVFWDRSTNPFVIKALKQIVADFNASSTDIEVKMVQVSGDETNIAKLMSAVASGTGPDVYRLDRFTVPERAATRLLHDITPFVNAEKIDLRKQYLDFAWQEVLYRNRVFGLPLETDTRVLYYRKDMLRQAGIDPEELSPENGPITTTRLKEIAFKMNRVDDSGDYTHVGFVPWGEQGWHYTWGFAFGGEFYDAEKCRVTPNNPNVVAAFNFLYDWSKMMRPRMAEKFMDSYFGTGSDFSPARHPFVTGRLGMVVSGNWFVTTLKKHLEDSQWGVTFIPTKNKSKATWSGGWSVVIPKNAKHPKEAYQFMRYYSSAEGQRTYVKIRKTMTTWKSLIKEKELLDSTDKFLWDTLFFSKSRPPLPVGALYWNQLTRAQQKIVTNKEKPEAALNAVKEKVQGRLERYCP